jgi:hypothetical protein
VVYEGTLPSFEGFATIVTSSDGDASLTLSLPQAHFCHLGVEDVRVASSRVSALGPAFDAAMIPRPAQIAGSTGDYIQLSEDILDVRDPYWSDQGNDCWDDLANADATTRQNVCSTTFGLAGDQSAARDFPILEAYDDHLVVGRFFGTLSNRQIVSADPSSAKELRRMRCCFHHEVKFHVRTGGEWVTTGDKVGLLSHVVADPATNACVLSCDPRDALLNARAFGLPRTPKATPPDRDSVLAMRNPMFSFLVWNGAMGTMDVRPSRDMTWKFTSTGEFVPLSVAISTMTTAVSPQSMRFIDSLGQLAVVDGSSQGLVLLDMSTVALAHTPYF